MGATSRLGVQGPVDDARDHGPWEARVAPGPRGILLDPLESEKEEATTPESDGVGPGREFLRDLLVLLPFGRPKDDPGPKDQPLRCRAAA